MAWDPVEVARATLSPVTRLPNPSFSVTVTVTDPPALAVVEDTTTVDLVAEGIPVFQVTVGVSVKVTAGVVFLAVKVTVSATVSVTVKAATPVVVALEAGV